MDTPDCLYPFVKYLINIWVENWMGIHESINGYFHHLVIVNSGAMNIFSHIFVRIPDINSMGYIPKSGID